MDLAKLAFMSASNCNVCLQNQVIGMRTQCAVGFSLLTGWEEYDGQGCCAWAHRVCLCSCEQMSMYMQGDICTTFTCEYSHPCSRAWSPVMFAPLAIKSRPCSVKSWCQLACNSQLLLKEATHGQLPLHNVMFRTWNVRILVNSPSSDSPEWHYPALIAQELFFINNTTLGEPGWFKEQGCGCTSSGWIKRKKNGIFVEWVSPSKMRKSSISVSHPCRTSELLIIVQFMNMELRSSVQTPTRL